MGLNTPQKNFWLHFIGDNLLPPMKYKEENIEFKSFNTNYMVWLLSHKGSVELYNFYVENQYAEILGIFTKKFNIPDIEEYNQLTVYIKNLAQIFYSSVDSGDEDMSIKIDTMTENYEEAASHTHNMQDMINSQMSSSQTTPHATSNKFSMVMPQDNINILNFTPSFPTNFNMNCDIFSEVINFNNNKNPLNIKEHLENSFEKSEDLGKMFNTSFDYDNEYMFQDE